MKRPFFGVLLSGPCLLSLSACRGDDLPRDPEPDAEEPYKNDTYQLGEIPDALPSSFEAHPPPCDEVLALAELPIRLFADDGHLFYFEVSPEAAQAGDSEACQTEPLPEGVQCPNRAMNVRVKPFGTELCADTGLVELELRGGKNFRPWLHIPTFSLDAGEFEPQKFGQGDSQLRFQNGQGGRTVLREAVALRIWKALGFPVPESSFVRSQSNVWDSAFAPGTWAAHLMLQRYKKKFFDDSMPDAQHVWEGEGDPFSAESLEDGWTQVDCEWSALMDCDSEALQALVTQVREAPSGAGFYAATESLVDWPSVHAFQCLSALTDTSKDWIHDGDSVVLVLTDEGKVRYLPKNLDRSGGVYADEGSPTPYRGSAFLLERCEEDADCAAAGLAVCEELLSDFDSLEVVRSIVDERYFTLEALGLVRDGDAEAHQAMKEYYEGAAERVRRELERL